MHVFAFQNCFQIATDITPLVVGAGIHCIVTHRRGTKVTGCIIRSRVARIFTPYDPAKYVRPIVRGVLPHLPRVQHRLQSAWALEPDELGQVDWLFSDMACYPERLLRLVREWMAAGSCRRFVCTLKLQGASDRAILQEFAAIPGSRLFHLACNKHELTWALV